MTKSLEPRIAFVTDRVGNRMSDPAPAHPIGRTADAIDIAQAVRFLASNDGGYMHGSKLVVDGGFTAQ